MSAIKKGYDSFASLYDRAMGDRGPYALLLRRLIRKHCPEARRVLELGCGTGTMLLPLSRYYETTGLELSPKMAALARKKSPRSRVVVGDMREFELGECFDAVIIPFDTINHLPSFGDWQRVFARARRHLRPGGVLIFDANTAYKFERYIHEPLDADVDDTSVAIVSVTTRGVNKYRVLIRVFQQQRSDLYRLHELQVDELVVSTERIVRALRKHFASVQVIDPDRARRSHYSEELFYVCR